MSKLLLLLLPLLCRPAVGQEAQPTEAPQTEAPAKATEAAPAAPDAPAAADDGDVDLWSQGKLALEVDQAEFDIPIVVNDRVEMWLRYFTGPGRPTYAHWMLRAPKYRSMMYSKLRRAGAPRDLVYLSMIESGYSPHARSPAAAVGLWQFIPSTGRLYGLRVGRWIDERRDPDLATDAAIRFLMDLYARFGHWYLAFSAYNCGPLCVQGAISRHGTRDFWKLANRSALPRETINYVPKLLAAAIIGKHPKRYGFTDIANQARRAPIYPRVEVDASIGIDVLADCYGTTVPKVININPQLVEFTLPPDGRLVSLRVPMDVRDAQKCLSLLR